MVRDRVQVISIVRHYPFVTLKPKDASAGTALQEMASHADQVRIQLLFTFYSLEFMKELAKS